MCEVTEIKATSKLTFQLNDRTWYSFEASRTMGMSGLSDEEVEAKNKELWDNVNAQVDENFREAVEINNYMIVPKNSH